MNSMLSPVPNRGILDIAPYVGGEAKAPGAKRVIRLASNESALGPSPRAMEAYHAVAGDMHRYPEGGCSALRQALAAHYGLDVARIVCGAGSDELIALLAKAYAGPETEILYSRHGFLMYPINAHVVGADPVAAPERDLTLDVDALLAKVTARTRIVFVTNPNNPTGTYISAAEMARLHAGLPRNVLLVIDAAYAEFVMRPDFEPGAALVEKTDNVVMLRTFSKIYALGGLRVGWGYFPAAVADVMNRVRNPFNVSSGGQAAALAALQDIPSFERARAHNAKWHGWLNNRLAEMGLTVTPSVANFVLARFPADPARNAAAAFAFLRSRGILTRLVAAYGLADWLRITIGTEEDMPIVAAEIAAFLGQS